MWFSARCDRLMKMLLEALSAIVAVHLSTVHGPVSASWSCIPPERKLWALLPRRTSWNSRKQFVAHIPSFQRQGMLWPTKGTDNLCDSTTFKPLFLSSIFTFLAPYQVLVACCAWTTFGNIPAVYWHSSANGDEAGILSTVRSRLA